MASEVEIAQRRIERLIAVSRQELINSQFIRDSIAEGNYKNDLRASIARLQNNINQGEQTSNRLRQSNNISNARLP